MPKYSIVLRVHNEKKEIDESVQSVINQTVTDWELIIIDDGSEIETQRIVDQCVKKDSRIRVVHQENQGGLGALRRGIQEAKGEYLAFLDAGDAYEPEYLKAADDTFRMSESDVDMVSFGFREIFPEHDRTYCIIEGRQTFESKELIRLMERTVSYYSLWLRVTKRTMFHYTEQEERFYDSIGKSGNYGDDLYLLSPVLRNCKRIVVMNIPLYRYVYDENSISRHFPGYTWQDAWNRNRLVEFTYQTFYDCGWIDEEILSNIQKHAVTLLAPCAKWIVRHSVRDRETQQLFRENHFFNHVVSKNRFGKNVPGGIKSRAALMMMKYLTAKSVC